MSNIPAKPEPKEQSESQIARKLEPYLRPDKKEQGLEVVTTLIKHHSGPLPAPEDFDYYNRVLPGGAERIMQLTEKEQAHRHKQEGRVVTGEYGTRILGQIGALLALAMFIGLVAYTATIGQPVTAAVIGAIGAVVVAFLKTSASQADKPEPEKKPPSSRGKRR